MPLKNLEGIVLNIVPETNHFGSGKADLIITHTCQKLFGKIVHDDQISYSEFAQDYVTWKNWPNPAFRYSNLVCDRLQSTCFRWRLTDFFQFFVQVIALEIFFVFFVPLCTLSSMVFSLAFRIVTGFLPVFLPDIREKPLAANATGTFSRGRFRHCIFSVVKQ